MTQRAAALRLLEARQAAGVTWRELATVENIGHGSASRTLSDLHRLGTVVRLTDEERNGCAVYVLEAHVGERRARPYTVRPPADHEAAAVMAARVEGVITRWGLDSSASPSLAALAADLRRAVNRPLPADVATLDVVVQ